MSIKIDFQNLADAGTEGFNLKLLKVLLDQTYDEFLIWDKEYRLVYINHACERHYGMKAVEMIGKSFWDFVEEGYWYPSILPIVFKEKKKRTIEQETYLGEKLITIATPILNMQDEIEFVVMSVRDEIKQSDVITKSLIDKKDIIDGKLKQDFCFEDCDIVTRSEKMKEQIILAKKVASVDSTILIQGESGTGKGLLAKYIHKVSHRKDGEILTINCAAIPNDLLEAELFGYTRGAFTGANRQGKKGLIELADQGTLFLDEIGELPLDLQAKLLQVVQENRFIPIGGEEIKTVDIRIIAATNRDLYEMTQKGTFREDLYYRLNVVKLNVPALKDRKEDVVPLSFYFLNKFDSKYGFVHQISEDALDVLEKYDWPGNVRELENIMERLVVTSYNEIIHKQDIPQSIIYSKKSVENLPLTLDEKKEMVERRMIIKAYEKYGSSRKVAKALEISQSRASRLIRKYINE